MAMARARKAVQAITATCRETIVSSWSMSFAISFSLQAKTTGMPDSLRMTERASHGATSRSRQLYAPGGFTTAPL